jgi:hypothetical protein
MGVCASGAAAEALLDPGAHGISSYLQYLPLSYPRMVRQTDETGLLQLYGDRAASSYVDVAPLDGIDDARGRSSGPVRDRIPRPRRSSIQREAHSGERRPRGRERRLDPSVFRPNYDLAVVFTF